MPPPDPFGTGERTLLFALTTDLGGVRSKHRYNGVAPDTFDFSSNVERQWSSGIPKKVLWDPACTERDLNGSRDLPTSVRSGSAAWRQIGRMEYEGDIASGVESQARARESG